MRLDEAGKFDRLIGGGNQRRPFKRRYPGFAKRGTDDFDASLPGEAKIM
jgi:hypothetical protein